MRLASELSNPSMEELHRDQYKENWRWKQYSYDKPERNRVNVNSTLAFIGLSYGPYSTITRLPK